MATIRTEEVSVGLLGSHVRHGIQGKMAPVLWFFLHVVPAPRSIQFDGQSTLGTFIAKRRIPRHKIYVS